MIGFNGGLIGKARATTLGPSVPGVWTAREQLEAQRIFAWPLNDADPNYASVSLLLHGDGTNGSTTITDNSQSPKTVTAVGNAQISTAQFKFGGSSIALDGTGDELNVLTNTDFGFGTGDFTLEFWLYYTGGNGYVFFLITNSGSGNYVGYGLNNGSKNPWVWNNTDVLTTTTPVTNNVWQHHAVVRNSGNLQIYLNGSSIGSTTWTNDLGATRPLTVGSNSAGGQFTSGYIDELRITKGVARYTAAFTPSTTPFPNNA